MSEQDEDDFERILRDGIKKIVSGGKYKSYFYGNGKICSDDVESYFREDSTSNSTSK